MVEELKRLRQAVETDPQDVASWVRLGNLYQDVAMYAEAAGFYERALAIRPDEPDVLTDLGICHQALAQGASPEAARASYEKALELFARANAARPDHWQSLFNTAVVAGIRLGRHEEADAALRKLEAIRPPVPHLDALRQALAEQRAGATAGRS
jgi:tetratricopeptide (TPR) repeat protein